MIRDASASGVAKRSESDVPLACASTPSRSRRNDTDGKLRLPRQRVRNDAATSYPSGGTGPAISYTVDNTRDHDVHNQSAGPAGDGWRKRQTVSRRSPDAHNQEARRLVASDARSARNTAARSTSPARLSDSFKQARPSTTREFLVWPDIPPTRELECDARGHSETCLNFSSCSVLGSVARQLSGWSPSGGCGGGGGRGEKGGEERRGTQTSLFSRSRHLACRVAPSRARAPVLGVASESS